MKAPPAALRPITASQLRKIIAGLGKRYSAMMPSNGVLTRLAVVFTARQPQHDLPPKSFVITFSTAHGSTEVAWEASGFPKRRTDALGNEYVTKAPLLPPGVLPVAWKEDPLHSYGLLGHPRYDEPTTWLDLAHDMAAEFHGAMGQTLGTRAAARFLEQVIPLVTGETPAAPTIRQHLVAPRQRKHPPKRIR
jgi:hypothetical protein